MLNDEGRGIEKDTYKAIQILKNIYSSGYTQAKSSLDSISQKWEEEYLKDHQNTSSYIYDDPNKAISLFHDIREKYHCSILDELDQCKERLIEMSDILMDKAIKKDDFNKIKELAHIGSSKVSSYCLEKLYTHCCLETYTCKDEYLYDEITYDDGISYYENCKDTSYEFSKDKWNELLNIYDAKAKQLSKVALMLMKSVYRYKHLLCMTT
ncbi:hypothetical protein NMU03_07230 [Allocoprobacillus halotolerans]|uniref:Uncharacterized protein n=1 Tax=Allocoprobacillus halotolerans TaxID=2944914 RepID=A0ABY5I945_9FIRM|nr:hypothetical protein [Allocoprobacillus halotolerans]UTY40558.1 hypothetical protein NMU03_07230 [Allocoprobacillus halotolerans]